MSFTPSPRPENHASSPLSSPLLRNGNLHLRAVEPEDALTMWEVESDSSQWIANSMAAPLSFRNLQEYAMNYDADPFRAGQLRLILCRTADESDSLLPKSATTIGIVDLYEISPLHRHAFIGIYIIPEFRQKGYAGKAIALIIDYARNLLGLNVLGAKTAESNHASQRLFTKYGFTPCGEFPQWLQAGQKRESMKLFAKII